MAVPVGDERPSHGACPSYLAAVLILYAVYLLLAFGLRTLIQLRRTGATGFDDELQRPLQSPRSQGPLTIRLFAMRRQGVVAVGAALFMFVVGSADAGAEPQRRSVPIGGDEIGEGTWSASISRIGGRFGDGPKGRLRPCLSVFGALPSADHSERSGFTGVSTLCAAYPSLTAEDEPLIVEGGEPTPYRAIESKLTVVAIALAPRVARVALTNFDGAETTIGTQALTGLQAKKARLARLRHLEFAIAGPYCVDHIVSYDAQGRQLWENGKLGRCPPQEFPQAGPR